MRGIDVKYFQDIPMGHRAKVALWIIAVIAATAGILGVGLLILGPKRIKPVILQGAVIRQASQADKELPLSDVEIIASQGSVSTSCKSDSSGFFKLALPSISQPKTPVTLQFRHPGYQPLDLAVVGGARLYVAKMIPTAQPRTARFRGPQVTVSNISVRYSVKTTTEVNVGSSVKTFQVVNAGNMPCKHQGPCSPDGKWKAAKDSVSLDAGEGNEFRNARASCIAGPCPFTRMTPLSFSQGRRVISVTALNWSDTATFLLEAEVFHPMASAGVHKSYPVIFGRVLNFTVPASAEGVCIKADVGGTPIIFPLGPNPVLQWADCQATVNRNKTQVYRCELTTGYRF